MSSTDTPAPAIEALAASRPDAPITPLSPRNDAKARALGIPTATGLVIGSIVGTGVFTMPAVLAGAGTMSIA
ncbi:MAG TPA: hypothetical protein VMD28_09325, partial [Acidimicrobiales bacterium]|nr:hypothetical protein [Acidimicrobiales bacterium]